MTEHEAETLAHWIRLTGWRGMDPSVREEFDGVWGVSINGFRAMVYLWEWPFFSEWWEGKTNR